MPGVPPTNAKRYKLRQPGGMHLAEPAPWQFPPTRSVTNFDNLMVCIWREILDLSQSNGLTKHCVLYN